MITAEQLKEIQEREQALRGVSLTSTQKSSNWKKKKLRTQSPDFLERSEISRSTDENRQRAKKMDQFVS